MSSSTLTSSAPMSTSAAPAPVTFSGVSNGAAAGIGIGCAVVGAIIAAILVVFFMHRKQRRHVTRSTSLGHSTRPSSHGSSGGGLAHTGTMITSVTKAAPTTTVERALEPPMQDSEIVGNVQRLGTAIKNHAQSYYASGGGGLAGSAAVSAEQLTTLLGSNAPVQPQTLATLLASPQSRTAAVRFIIAWSVLRGTNGSLETSLLPPELARSLEVIHAGRSNRKEWPLMLSRWRQMTASLMREIHDTADISQFDYRKRTVSGLANTLNGVLAPIASSSRGSDADRGENLEELVKRGARLEYMFFTQPTEWDFVWNESAKQKGTLVVLPGLVRTADEKGTRLAQPHSFGAAQVVDVGSPRAQAR